MLSEHASLCKCKQGVNSLMSRRGEKPFVARDYRDTTHVRRATLRSCGRRRIGITAVGNRDRFGLQLECHVMAQLEVKTNITSQNVFYNVSFLSLYTFCWTNVFEQISSAFELRFITFIGNYFVENFFKMEVCLKP